MLLDSGTYKIWFSGAGGPWQTGYATSPDAHTWTIHPGNPVLQVGAPGSWDELEANGPSVIKDGATYKMWYHGANNDYSTTGIGYATSTDGIAWTKHPGNPVLTPGIGTWDEKGVGWPRVIKNGSVYEMWYFADGKVGRATSTDGVSWTKYAGNPVIGGDWGGQVIRGGSVLFDGSTYRMWFRSKPMQEGRIGLATSPDGINWTMHPGNPVLDPGSPTVWGESTISVSGVGGHTLDGLTITGARACQEGAGGVSIQNAVALVSHSQLIGNQAIGGCGGGGIGAMGSGANLTLEYSLVKVNQGNGGGGVMSWDGAYIFMNHTEVNSNLDDGWGGGGVFVGNNGASMVISESLILNNRNDTGPGGGIFLESFSSFKMQNSIVQNNHSQSDGGGVFVRDGQAIIEYSDILNNTSAANGGGVLVGRDAGLDMKRTTVRANTAGYQGGGLALYGDLTLMDSQVLDNQSFGGGGGAGIAVFGPDGGGALNATNTVIAGNQGLDGGGIAPFWRGSLVNVTVADNSCSGCSYAGIIAPADVLNSPKVIRNTIVYNNSSGSLDCQGDCDVQYSDIEGGWAGIGNFDAPPALMGLLTRTSCWTAARPALIRAQRRARRTTTWKATSARSTKDTTWGRMNTADLTRWGRW